MTSQEIRIAIGLHVGTLKIHDHGDDEGPVPTWTTCAVPIRFPGLPNDPRFPDYPASLDAMRRAELHRWRDEEFIEAYEEAIREAYRKAVGDTGAGYWWMAPAKIRAEAFVRALGLWKED